MLTLAQQEFDAFITVDRKLSEHQDLASIKIVVLLLRAWTNRLQDLRRLVPELLQKLAAAPAGALTLIGV